ncbi:hypothetical protein LZ495_15805 [Yinghuangia sp. KLBMP8922]|uniref:Uncharacterized protein n=1 Tax=Yinghuangia soli TaxID=2908204 RepID=A0AA41Q235_9ACTN|nr:hypothetical protein [Yinghuangia soli]
MPLPEGGGETLPGEPFLSPEPGLVVLDLPDLVTEPTEPLPLSGPLIARRSSMGTECTFGGGGNVGGVIVANWLAATSYDDASRVICCAASSWSALMAVSWAVTITACAGAAKPIAGFALASFTNAMLCVGSGGICTLPMSTPRLPLMLPTLVVY